VSAATSSPSQRAPAQPAAAPHRAPHRRR
jgi:hypothetical protein